MARGCRLESAALEAVRRAVLAGLEGCPGPGHNFVVLKQWVGVIVKGLLGLEGSLRVKNVKIHSYLEAPAKIEDQSELPRFQKCLKNRQIIGWLLPRVILKILKSLEKTRAWHESTILRRLTSVADTCLLLHDRSQFFRTMNHAGALGKTHPNVKDKT